MDISANFCFSLKAAWVLKSGAEKLAGVCATDRSQPGLTELSAALMQLPKSEILSTHLRNIKAVVSPTLARRYGCIVI